MDERNPQVRDLGIAARLSPLPKVAQDATNGRQCQVTCVERKSLTLESRREAEGKALSEWAREVLLDRAQKGKAE